MRPWLTLATTTSPFSFTLSTDEGSTDYLITTSLTNTGSFSCRVTGGTAGIRATPSEQEW